MLVKRGSKEPTLSTKAVEKFWFHTPFKIAFYF